MMLLIGLDCPELAARSANPESRTLEQISQEAKIKFLPL
jgi:hypothetical protein